MDGRKVAVWTSTNRCNLNCKFCFGKEGKPELDRADAMKLIEKMKSRGAKYFVFSGGEPLLRRDILELADFARKLGMKTFLHTNGILVNGENAGEIARHFDAVNVPIDGASEGANLSMGRGSLKHTLEVLDLLAGKCETRVTTVAARTNLAEMGKIADLLRNKKISKWRIFQFDPKLGEAKVNRKMFEISPEEFAKLREKIKPENCEAEFVKNDGGFGKKYWMVSSDGKISSPE